MKVDFYILEDASSQKSLFFACQLLEKIYAEQKRMFVHLRSLEEAERFDALLWTYKEDSFIPHQLDRSAEPHPPPIQLGWGEAPTQAHENMLNLCTDIPVFHTQFQHIIEIVFSDPVVQQLARERYKRYRELGYELNTYKQKAS